MEQMAQPKPQHWSKHKQNILIQTKMIAPKSKETDEQLVQQEKLSLNTRDLWICKFETQKEQNPQSGGCLSLP